MLAISPSEVAIVCIDSIAHAVFYSIGSSQALAAILTRFLSTRLAFDIHFAQISSVTRWAFTNLEWFSRESRTRTTDSTMLTKVGLAEWIQRLLGELKLTFHFLFVNLAQHPRHPRRTETGIAPFISQTTDTIPTICTVEITTLILGESVVESIPSGENPHPKRRYPTARH